MLTLRLHLTLSSERQDSIADLVEGNAAEWDALFKEWARVQLESFPPREGWPELERRVDEIAQAASGNTSREVNPRALDGQQSGSADDDDAPGYAWATFPWVSDTRSEWYGLDVRRFARAELVRGDGSAAGLSISSDGSLASSLSSASSLSAATPFSIDSDLQIEVRIEYVPTVTVRQSCIVLSTLLRYTPETTGSVYHLMALRRCILPVILDEIMEQTPILFDRGHLQDIMEEWLLVPSATGFDYATGSGFESPSFGYIEEDMIAVDPPTQADRPSNVWFNWESYGHAGRSAGVLLTGAKGMGKSTFALEMISVMQAVAPWMFTVVHKDMDRNLEDGQLPSNLTRCEFFDGGNFHADVAAANSGHTLSAFFEYMRGAARPGKMVLTFVDDVDIIVLGKESAEMLDQFAIEVNNCNFELFMVTTSSTSAIPSFANVDFSKNFHQISLLRSLKLYDAPLARSYDIILKHVHSAPALAYGGDVNEAMRACAMQAYELDLMKDEAYIAKRRLLESYLHNMKIPDLKKVSLQLCLHIAAVVKGDPVARAGLTFQSALEVVLNRRDVLTGVSPDVGASMEWVRHPLHVGDPDQLNAIADSIFHRSKNNKQYVFFVHIRPNDDAYDEELEKKVYGDYEDANGRFKRYTIPHRSVPTLLHQLHKRFMFRASFQLRAPTQLLPHNALHSSFLPYSNANPFNEYYWHHKNSLLVIDDLDTVVGYHEFHKVGEGSSSSTGRAMAESVDHSHAVGRRFHVGIGGNANGSRTAMTGASDAETMVAASESGAAAGAGVGVSWDLLQTGNAFIAAEQGWAQSRALAHTVENALTNGLGFGPGINGGGGASFEEFFGQQGRDVTVNNASTSKNVGIDQHFNHTEACAKLVIGLRAVRENAVRDVENLENVIVIFYKNFEVLKEIVYHRLGWYMDGSYDTPASGCVHYKRNIKFQAPCCKRWVACEQCHDEMFPDHTMDKSLVEVVQCRSCFARQRITDNTRLVEEMYPQELPLGDGKRCVQCAHSFANTSCVPCRIWTDEHHVEQDDVDEHSRGTVHCDSCNKCFPTRFIGYHREVCVSG